jgi:hypothetical protein
MPKGKAAAERRHAKRRARLRFDLDLTDEDLRQAVKAIQAGEAKHYETQSNRVTKFDLTLKGVLVRVAYDKTTKEIITVMRPRVEGSVLDLLRD